MSIESDSFTSYSVDEKKLVEFGFEKSGDTLEYACDFPEFNMRAHVTYDGTLTGKIIDLEFDDEYTNHRLEAAMGYSAQVRERFEKLLLEIRDTCCKNQYFESEQARRVNSRIFDSYGIMPEFLWPNIPTYAAFRRKVGKDKKWFAVIGSVPLCKVDAASSSKEPVEVINLKVDKGELEGYLSRKGFSPPST